MKHIDFIASLLRSKFAMSGMRVDAVTPDSQPTVNRRSRLTSQQRHYSVTSARVAQEWLKYAAIAVMLFTIAVGNVWGASFAPSDFSGQGTSGTGSAISATVDGVTFACDKGYGTTQIRCYSGGKITICSSNTITAISFTFSGSSYKGGLNASYTGLSTTSRTFTLTGQARITACTVTVAASTKTYTLKVPDGTGGYTTYSSQEQSAMTESTATGGNSCTYGLAGYYSGWREGALENPANSPGTTYNHATASGMPASGTTLYAVFANDAGKYLTNPLCDACDNGTITYARGTVPAGGGSITGSHDNDTKVCETNLTLPGAVFTTTGYTQTGWATSDGGSQAYALSATNYATEGDATLYPVWTAEKYTVTWSVNGSTYQTTSNVTFNTTTSTPANPSVPGECTGSTFMGWTATADYSDPSSAPGNMFNGTSPTITGDITFYAVFADED